MGCMMQGKTEVLLQVARRLVLENELGALRDSPAQVLAAAPAFGVAALGGAVAFLLRTGTGSRLGRRLLRAVALGFAHRC